MKSIFSGILAFFFLNTANACDICGCGVGGNYIGLLPDFKKIVFGVRYRQNNLRTHIGAGGQTSYLTTDETYRTTEIWGGFQLGKKFRLMGYVPLNINEKWNQGQHFHTSGLGDIGLQAYYNLLNLRKTAGPRLLIQSLWLGLGVKAPTGRYENSKAESNTANLFQLGTGSIDATLHAMYDLRLNDAGISVVGSYKINSSNRYDYRYGNKFSAAAQLYHKWRFKNNIGLAPNAGVVIESAARDHDRGFKTDVSGGQLLSAVAGLEISRGKWALGGNFQLPVYQQLANGFVHAGNRGMIHLSIAL